MTWTAKSIDVDAAQWKRVKAAAAADGMELRVWLWRCIRRSLGEQELPELRPPATVTKLGGIVVMESFDEGK
jgi:hypothetical protein